MINGDGLIKRFAERVSAGTGSIFVGAGMSTYAGYPSWNSLVEPYRKKIGIPQIDDLPQLVQYFEDNSINGRKEIEKRVLTTFKKRSGSKPSVFHQLVSELPVKSIWTTNYDSLIEDNVPNGVVFAEDEDLSGPIPPNNIPVYKMHGSVVNRSKRVTLTPIVLSKNDYENYTITHPRFWSLLRSEMLSGSMLFLGFSFQDPNIDQILRFVRSLKLKTKASHYAVLKRPGGKEHSKLFDLRAKELEVVGIEVVEISDYSEIDAIVSGLHIRSRPSRLFISGSPTGPRKKKYKIVLSHI